MDYDLRNNVEVFLIIFEELLYQIKQKANHAQIKLGIV